MVRKGWLKSFLKPNNGIPNYDTFSRVFPRIDPNDFRDCSTKWTRVIMGRSPTMKGWVWRERYTACKGDICWEYRAPSQGCNKNKQEGRGSLHTAFRKPYHCETVAIWKNPPHVCLDVHSIPLSSKDSKGIRGQYRPWASFLWVYSNRPKAESDKSMIHLFPKLFLCVLPDISIFMQMPCYSG
jgi:hypothetical protein